MPGPYPLATLAPTITSAGITIPSYNDIYASLQASAQQIYGSDVVITPDSQDGQMLAVFAQAQNDTNNAIVTVLQSYMPSFAQGAALSAMVRTNGLTRNVATNSTVLVTLVGNANTTISNGVIQDTANNLWNLPASVTIGAGGTALVTATAQQPGNIAAQINSVNVIYTPQLGWASVNNPTNAAVPGAPVETDAQLRIRQAASVSLPALSPLSAIFAAIGAIPGVTRWTVYENNTALTDNNGVPSHSIDCIVQGGSSATIAATIQKYKSEGTGTFGGTNVVVVDPGSGLPVSINFDFLTQTQIYVNVTVKALPSWSSANIALVQASVANFINQLAIGNAVYTSQVQAAAQLDDQGASYGSFYITALTLGTAPSPTGTANIPIAFNAAAACSAANVGVTVT